MEVFSFLILYQNKTEHEKTRLSVPLCLSAFVLFYSCRKTDAPAASPSSTLNERFFALFSSAPAQVKAIAESVKKQNEKFSFLYDPAKANNFASRYPPCQTINPQTGQPYPPEFPDPPVFDYYDKAKTYFKENLGYSKLLSDAMDMAFVLEKYDTGIAILKQDANGDFKILRAKQTSTQGPIGNFEDVSCN